MILDPSNVIAHVVADSSVAPDDPVVMMHHQEEKEGIVFNDSCLICFFGCLFPRLSSSIISSSRSPLYEAADGKRQERERERERVSGEVRAFRVSWELEVFVPASRNASF